MKIVIDIPNDVPQTMEQCTQEREMQKEEIKRIGWYNAIKKFYHTEDKNADSN